MKKISLLTWKVAALAAAILFAVVADPPRAAAAPFNKRITFTQPSGDVVYLWGRGDEFSAVFETMDGYSVVFDPSQRAYCYAQLAPDGSKLVSTGTQVQLSTGASLGLTQHLRMNTTALKAQISERYAKWDNVMKVSERWSALKAQSRAANGQPAPPTTPTVGLKVGLCLLIDFSDDQATIPQSDIDNFCNGDNFTLFGNNGSVKKYYKDVSNGLLTYSNVVTIYIRVPQPKSYYNDVTKDAGAQANILIKDAIDAMKALPNYTTDILPTFDGLTVDANNQVVAFNVFYAGDNGGVWSMGLWPHSWGLYDAGAQELSTGGKKVFRYQITNIGAALEIGTFCHENGHMLCGYPDLYDYTYLSVGVGMWCLMASGNYGGNGGDPVEICAYLRRASGWATTTEIYGVSNMLATVYSAPNTNFNRFYRYQKPNVSTEYYLIECRYPQGRDNAVPGGGVAVWHIDELGNNSTVNLNPNPDHDNYEATLVQADGKWDLERYANEGDPNDVYYQENNASVYSNELSDTTYPHSHWWDGTTSGMKLKDFSARNSTMTFTIGDNPTPPPPDDSVDVAIRIVANPDPVLVNGNLYYTVTVTNRGNIAAADVAVAQQLSTSCIFLNATVTNGTATQMGGVLTWTIGTLPGFSAVSMVVLVKPVAVGMMYSSATVTTSSSDPNPSNNEALISTWVRPPTTDLTLNMTDSPDPVLIGETLTYNAAVTNRGPSVATGVNLTVNLPSGVLLKSVTPSQGTWTFVGSTINCSLGSLTNGQRATVAIVATPVQSGTLAASGSVTGTQYDPVPQNNVVFISTAVSPAADLTMSMTVAPNPGVVNSNFTYQMMVTNHGPSAASAVVVNQTLPAGVTFVSASTSQGTVSSVSGNVVANLGTIGINAAATITVTAKSGTAGLYSSTATASATQADQNPADNSATTSVTIAKPFVSIVAAGSTLTAESFTPANGAIEPNEVVTVQLRLRNVGNVSNTNLVATLLETNGVAYVAGNIYTNSFGVLPGAGLPVAGSFTFRAVSTSNGMVIATLRLRDGGKDIGTVAFTFYLPIVTPFSNTALITIPSAGAATPYPSVIKVSGVTGVVGNVTVTLSNLNHSFPTDVNVLLVGPGDQRVILMSHAGGSPVNPNPIVNSTVTFDATASTVLPATDQINSGSYRPAAYGSAVTFPAPAPTNGYGTVLTVFNGANPNGDWKLYILDDSAGDQGQVTQGWSLSIKTIFPVNKIADLSLAATAPAGSVLAGDPVTFLFTVQNAGPDSTANATFTNVLPASLRLVSVKTSQGSVLTNGSALICYLGAIPSGGTATITNVVVPRADGVITNRASVFSSEIDLNPSNNYASATITSVLPQADLALALAAPTNAIVTSNLTYTFTVTNLGPQLGMSVLATNTLPAGVSLVSVFGTNATCTNFGQQVVADFGDLTLGAGGVVVIKTLVNSAGKLTNTVVASTASADPTVPNKAFVVTTAKQPAPVIASAGTTLISQSHRPPNGVVNPGETVTIAFSLVNVGQVASANLVASLLATNGVTAPSASQTYGLLAPDGPAISRKFTFSINSNATTVVATLALSDGTNDLGFAFFPLDMPGNAVRFATAVPVTIPDHGAARPYPSTIYVSNMMGLVSQVVVTLSNLTHTFPSDVNVLLASPGGQAVPLMASVGYGHSATNITLRFDDKAALFLPRNASLVSGSYKPTSYLPTPFPYPAPSGPYGTQLVEFNGFNPNGLWRLYIVDGSPGDAGSLGGWSLDISTVSPLNPAANIAVTGGDAPTTVYAGSLLTNTFLIVNEGPDNAPGVMLTNTIPVGATLVSAEISQGTITNSGGQLLCDVGSMPNGASASFTVVLMPSTGQTLTNTAEAYPAATDLNLANNIATLSTAVIVPPSPRLKGSFDPVAKIFTITLAGESEVSYNILISSDLTSWTLLTSGTTGADGILQVTDDSASTEPVRFYRAQRTP